MTPESRGLISKLEGSSFFNVTFSTFSENEANNLLHRNKCRCNSEYSVRFRKGHRKEIQEKFLLSIDAINASTAQLSWAYLNGVIRDYNLDLLTENISSIPVSIHRLKLRSPTGTGIMKC